MSRDRAQFGKKKKEETERKKRKEGKGKILLEKARRLSEKKRAGKKRPKYGTGESKLQGRGIRSGLRFICPEMVIDTWMRKREVAYVQRGS